MLPWLPLQEGSGPLPRSTTEVRYAAHVANETVVQCEVLYFMILHNNLVYTGLPAGDEYSSHGILRVLRNLKVT